MIGNAVKTTARPDQSNDLAQDSEYIVSSTMNLSQLSGGSDSIDLSDTQRWAETPSTWKKDDWNRDACVEFRVRCDGQPTRRLRLAGARYTLGSGVGCSIRLDDASLRPLHAVLIRDHERVLVRAYSVPFQINNVRVTEGTLELNDRLRLGNYEFELLSNTPLPITPVQPKAHALNADMAAEQQKWQKSFHDEAKHWRALKHDVERRDAWCQTREREVTEQRARLDRQMELLQKRQDELASQESAALEVHDEFTHRYDELRQRQEELELQQEELEAGREHLRLQQERLDGRDRLHRVQIEKLLGEQDRFKDLDKAQKRLIADTEEQLRMSHERADAANAAVEQMRKKFASLNEQLLQLTQQQEALHALEAQRNREHQLRCDTLAVSRDEAMSQRDEMARQRDSEIDARAKSDARREKALLRCDELESIEEKLRAEIEQLQDEITATRGEATKLDLEFRTASEKISQLEQTVHSNEARHESDRLSWTSEVELLRKNVDDLTLELAGAQVQLTKLREENDRLAEQLTGAHQERDDARQKQEAAAQECEAANARCRETKAELDAANAKLDDALTQCENARRERDEIDQQRVTIEAELGETRELREDWERRTELAERRYKDAQSMLAEARDQWQKAEHARDDAETSRQAAEEKLAQTQRDLQSMQRERDEAVSEFNDLRRQRDAAVNDADETRRMFDRSNRDHDETLDRIEHLEQRTRDVIEDKKKRSVEDSAKPSFGPKLSLVSEAVLSEEASGVVGFSNATNRTESSDGSDAVNVVGFHHRAEYPNDNAERPTEAIAMKDSNPHDVIQEDDAAPELMTEQPPAIDQPAIDHSSIDHSAVTHSVAEIDDDVWPTYSVATSPEPEPIATSTEGSPTSGSPADGSPAGDFNSAPNWPAEDQTMLRPEDHFGEDSLGIRTGPSVEGIAAEDQAPSAAQESVEPRWNHLLSQDSSEDVSEFSNTDFASALVASALVDQDEPNDSPAIASVPSLTEGTAFNESLGGSMVDPLDSEFDDVAHRELDAHHGGPLQHEMPYPDLGDESHHDSYPEPYQGFHQNTHEESHEDAHEESLSDRLLREMGIAKKEAARQERADADLAPPEPIQNAWDMDAEVDSPAAALDCHTDTDYDSVNMTAQWQPNQSFDNHFGVTESEESTVSNGFRSTAEVSPSSRAEEEPIDSLIDDRVDTPVNDHSVNQQLDGVDVSVESDEQSSQYGAMLSAMAESRLQDGNQYESDDDDDQVAGLDKEVMLDTTKSHVFTEAEEVEPEDEYRSERESESMSLGKVGGDAPASGGVDAADDDSIEAYMNRLLQRVQGSSDSSGNSHGGSKPAVKPTTPKPTESSLKSAKKVDDTKSSVSAKFGETSATTTDDSQSDSEAGDADAQFDPKAPLIPRSHAPERNSNLSAMRELANESARSAITRSQRSQSHTTRIQAMLKFVYAGVALVCGLVAVAMIDLVMLKVIAVIAAVVAAGIFVKEGITLMTDLVGRNGQARTAEVADED